nr:hypothetical protein [Pseudonocardiales bacterium]
NNEWPTGGFPATGLDGKPLSEHPAFKGGMKPMPDVAEAPGGHLWDLARKHNLIRIRFTRRAWPAENKLRFQGLLARAERGE